GVENARPPAPAHQLAVVAEPLVKVAVAVADGVEEVEAEPPADQEVLGRRGVRVERHVPQIQSLAATSRSGAGAGATQRSRTATTILQQSVARITAAGWRRGPGRAVRPRSRGCG